VASEVPGVKEVRNELVVTPTEAYEDRKIAAAVVRSLQRVPGLPVEDLDVSVEDGEVSISGSVADAAHMLAMRKALEKTRGVRATHYRVEVESELVES
jgi:osmotically-inducible protein OsmY